MTAQQLKNSILQMAVQGKLVPQDPNDEPASVLLERIRAEKEQLIKQGKIKKEKNPSVIFRGADNIPYEKVGTAEPVSLEDEVPFEIPDSWEWVRIRSLGEIVRGSGIKRTETTAEGYPCVRYGELYTTYTTSFTEAVSFIPAALFERCKHFRHGDILVTLTGENKPDIAKAVAYMGDAEIAAGGDLAFWTHHGMNSLFLAYMLASPYLINRKVALATGDIIIHISGEKLGSILIPVPPLSEQQRIVERMKEVEVYIAEYSSAEKSLSALNITFPDRLKKSILQMAVQGKLVPQDPADEPAEALLGRIREEKQRLVKEGKIKKDKQESIIFRRDNSHYEKLGGIERCIDEELPFEIPETWSWVRAASLGTFIRGSGIKRTETTPTGLPCVRYGELYTTYTYSFNVVKSFVPEALHATCKHFSYGDILFSLTGENKQEIGKAAAYMGHELIAAGGDLAYWTYHGMNPKYLAYFMYSPYAIYRKANLATGDIIVHISGDKLGSIFVPIPPLAEQQRIVDCIETVYKMV